MDIALRAAPFGARLPSFARIVASLLKGRVRRFAATRLDLTSDRQLRDLGLQDGPYDRADHARDALHWRAPML